MLGEGAGSRPGDVKHDGDSEPVKDSGDINRHWGIWKGASIERMNSPLTFSSSCSPQTQWEPSVGFSLTSPFCHHFRYFLEVWNVSSWQFVTGSYRIPICMLLTDFLRLSVR